MTTARIVEHGGRQSVQLPKGLRFRGTAVEVIQRGDEVVLREVRQNLAEAFELLISLSDDFMEEGRNQPPAQSRESL